MKKIMALTLFLLSNVIRPDVVDRVFWGTATVVAVAVGGKYLYDRESNASVIKKTVDLCEEWEKATKDVVVDKENLKDKTHLSANVAALGCKKTPLQAPRKITELGGGLLDASARLDSRFAFWKFWNQFFSDEDIEALKERVKHDKELYLLLEQYFQYHAIPLRNMRNASSAGSDKEYVDFLVRSGQL